MRRSQGFTLVELAVSVGISATVLIAATVLASSITEASSSASVRAAVFARASKAAEVLARDLQTSSVLGEDRNGNGLLDADEDTNASGTLDADWNLADGSLASSLVFNRLNRDWQWSPAITYEVVGGVLRRTESGSGTREICRRVGTFTVSRSGSTVDVLVRVVATDSRGGRWSETATRRIHVRN